MQLMRWDPLRQLVDFDRAFRSFSGGSEEAPWAPAVDIAETGDQLVIRADLAGVEKDDIDVRVEDNTLILRGKKKRDKEFKEEQAYRVERTYGSFLRSFRLPETVDAARIAATMKNGVLEIRLPKAEEAKPRKVEIAAA